MPAGNDIANTRRMPELNESTKPLSFPSVKYFVISGKNTVTIAIVKTPNGNSINRLAKYNSDAEVSFSEKANKRLTKILICSIAAPRRPGRKSCHNSRSD